MVAVGIPRSPGAVPRRAHLTQQQPKHPPHVWESGLCRGLKGGVFGARTVGRLVQEAADERAGGRCAVELGQAHRGQEVTQAEATRDEQAHELRPVIQEGVHEGGLQVDGLTGVG